MTAKTNFRSLDRIPFAKDIEVDHNAEALHDRIAALRGRTGRYTPDEMGIQASVWRKMSSAAKDREIVNFIAGIEIKAMTFEEFQTALTESREALGV